VSSKALMLLSRVIAAFHWIFIAFVVFGGLLCFWRKTVAWLHVPSLLWSAMSGLFLPVLENWLRFLAQRSYYSGGFLDYYVFHSVLETPPPTHNVYIAIYTTVLVGNAVLYLFIYRNRIFSHLCLASGKNIGR